MGSLRVECYAGYRGAERPVRFTMGGVVYDIEEIEDRWYSPGAAWFKVRTHDAAVYILRHDETRNIWLLDSYRSPIRSRPRNHSC